jgi:hypothetical protein
VDGRDKPGHDEFVAIAFTIQTAVIVSGRLLGYSLLSGTHLSPQRAAIPPLGESSAPQDEDAGEILFLLAIARELPRPHRPRHQERGA